MKAVVETLTGIGLRDRVKVMVGGAPVTQAFAEEIGADMYGKDFGTATRLAKQFLGLPWMDQLSATINAHNSIRRFR